MLLHTRAKDALLGTAMEERIAALREIVGARPGLDDRGRCHSRRGAPALRTRSPPRSQSWRIFAHAGHGWQDRMDIRTAEHPSPPASALLIRPDGFLAWAAATDAEDIGTLHDALTTWFGTPATGADGSVAGVAPAI